MDERLIAIFNERTKGAVDLSEQLSKVTHGFEQATVMLAHVMCLTWAIIDAGELADQPAKQASAYRYGLTIVGELLEQCVEQFSDLHAADQ